MALQTAYETPLAGAEAFFTSYFAALQTFELTPLMRHYASEVTAFEVIGQLSCEGRDAYEKHWRCCMEMCEDAFFEPGKRKMSVSENLRRSRPDPLRHYQCGAAAIQRSDALYPGWPKAQRRLADHP